MSDAGFDAGFYLISTVFDENVTGDKRHKPRQQWFLTRPEADTAKADFRQRYPQSDAVACVVPARSAPKRIRPGKRGK